jgi:hypothetical protein
MIFEPDDRVADVRHGLTILDHVDLQLVVA